MNTLAYLSHVFVLLASVTLNLSSCIGCLAQTAEEIAELQKQVTRLQEESKWNQAMPLAEKLVTITSSYFGHDSPEMAEALHKWAWLIQNNGDHSKAEKLWLQALTIDEKAFGKGMVQTTRRLHLLANLRRDLGRYDEAGELLKQALAIREQHYGPDHPATAEILRSLGQLATQSGNYADAETNLSRALSSYQKAGHYELGSVATTLSIMGWLAAEMGDQNLSGQRMHNALQIRQKLYGEEHDTVAQSCSDLASIYHWQGDLQRAIALYKRGLAIRQKLHGTNHRSVAVIESNLGWVYLANGQLLLAESLLEHARRVFEKHPDHQYADLSDAMARLSKLAEKRAAVREAERFCAQAYNLREKHLGPSHYDTLKSLRDLVRLRAVLGKPDQALAVAERLQDGEEAVLRNLLSFTSARQRLISQQQTSPFVDRFSLWADLRAVKPLARAIFRTKGLVLDSLLEDRVLTESHGTKEVRELADQLQQARQRLTQLSPTVLRHEFRWQQSTNQKALCAEIEALQAMLARQVAGLGRARRALSIRLEDVQAAIPEGTVLLEMLRYRHGMGEKAGEERYGTLIISRHEEPQWICLGGADEIEKTLKIHQHAVRNSATPEPLVHSLTELYRHVWAPLAAHLPVDSKRIIISPDGGLNFVSFATLLAPDKSFLGEQYSFGYVSCGRDLTAEAPASLSRDLLVWANPDFDASLTASSEDGGTIRSAELRGLDFRPLPGAEKEGRDLFRRASALGFTNSALHLGRAATEEQLLQVRSPKVLHLATHGFLFPPMNAVTERNFASDLGVRDAQSSSTDPMLCSGLALAGARLTLQLWAEGKETSARNDGILTADDIGVLDLRRTWLVVLSACDTGLGEARGGEGVFGLRRGFTQAGAQNLLLTLWPIDDERTRDLISDFYTQLEICASPANALADVQRKWLKRLRAEGGIAEACRIAGPFILSFQGKPGEHP